MLRGAGKVGSALVTTQGEQLRLMACNSSIAPGVKVAQDVVEGLVGAFMGGSNSPVSIPEFLNLNPSLKTCYVHEPAHHVMSWGNKKLIIYPAKLT